MEDKKSVKIGIIGAGHLGRYHIECTKRIPGFILQGIYDIDQDRSEEISYQYGINRYDNFQDMLDEVEAVVVVTPTSTHYDIALETIHAGKNLFIEKPLTDNPLTSRELVKLIEGKKLVGRVGNVES